MKNLLKMAGLAVLMIGAAGLLPALAQTATDAKTAAAAAAPAAPIMDKGDVSWMMTSSALVLFMTIPGLALFYGGLVRSKNMLSILMQTTMIACMVMVMWVIYGYSVTFGGGTSPYWGGFGKVFLKGVNASSMSATLSAGYVIPEYVFICFQMTFAAITPGLIIGAWAERVKFKAVLLFMLLWTTFAYFPIAHMVWDASGLLFQMGAIDFAGGTVVHINAGIAAFVGALVIGKRVGYGKENMAPHSMVMTMIGASMLWFGWFGFNVGSNLEANGGAGLAMINTFVATAAAALTWSGVEAMQRGKASMLGAASGMVAGLVAITPACGTVGPMGAIILGIVVAVICYYFVTVVKNMFKYDDSLDVFGVHCIGGIIGAMGTGVLSAGWLGGVKDDTYSIAGQSVIQFEAVALTLIWSGVVAFVCYKIADMVFGLRVEPEVEREGLDQASHGETAYHS